MKIKLKHLNRKMPRIETIKEMKIIKAIKLIKILTQKMSMMKTSSKPLANQTIPKRIRIKITITTRKVAKILIQI